jgi:hypothetical protein
MKRYRVIGSIALIAALVYVGSYAIAFRNGHYEAAALGLSQHPDGYVIQAPKSAFGYDWNPFGTNRWAENSQPGWIGPVATFYAPVIWFDRAFVHRNKTVEQAGSGRYKVKWYFDIKTHEVRDIEP